jgi:hypothetical protein
MICVGIALHCVAAHDDQPWQALAQHFVAAPRHFVDGR